MPNSDAAVLKGSSDAAVLKGSSDAAVLKGSSDAAVLKGSSEAVQTSADAMSGAGDATIAVVQISVPVGSFGQGFLTHYESPYKFWISLLEHLEEFTETTLLIAKQSELSPPTRPKVGDTYGVQWDGEWARVEVTAVSGQEVTVYFMDYGNSAAVQVKDLRPVTLDIMKLPAQALCCCVSKVRPVENSWTEAAVAATREWFGAPMCRYLNFEVVAKKGAMTAVKIIIEKEGLSTMLINGGFGVNDPGQPGLPSFTQAQPAKFTVKDLKSEISTVTVGEQLLTVMTDLQSLNKFFCLKQTAVAVFEKLTPLMASEFSDGQPSYRPVVGEVVAAKYSADNLWYRSRVLKVKGDVCSLFFIDYGNSEDQTVNNVREIRKQELKDIPAQILTCCLDGLDREMAAIPDDQLLMQFAELLPGFQVDESFTLLSVKSKTEDELVVDIVSTKGLSLVAALRKNLGLSAASPAATSTPAQQPQRGTPELSSPPKNAVQKQQPAPVVQLEAETLAVNADKTVSMVIPYIKSCSEFYVRPAANDDSFTAIMKDLNEKIQLRPIVASRPALGSYVVAQFKADQLWYRAKVLRLEPNNGTRCKVQFVDYGNIETAMWAELRSLDAGSVRLPSQAVKCHLAGGDLDTLAVESHQELKQFLENETVEVTVMEKNQGSGDEGVSFGLKISANGVCVNDLLFGAVAPPVARKIANASLKSGSVVKVECVNLASPAEFYVQISSCAMASVEVTLKLKARLEKNPEPAGVVCPGDFVASRFSQDDDVTWYRARVDKVNGEKASVFFVDFGMCDERACSELMCLSAEDCEVPAGTVRCKLRNCPASTLIMDEKFGNEGQSIIDSIRVVSQDEQGCVVDVLDSDGKCITELFTKPQTPKKSSVAAKSANPSPKDVRPQASVAPCTSAPSAPKSAAVTSTSLQSSPQRTEPTSTQGPFFTTQSMPAGDSSSQGSPVTVLHIDSFSEVYVWAMDEDLQRGLLELMVTLGSCAGSLPPLADPTPGSLCAACFSQDGEWYRAKLTKPASGPRCTVQFVDYGNSEETLVQKLRDLSVADDPTLTSYPAQAIRCCIQGFEGEIGREGSGQGAELLEQLRSELHEKPFLLEVAGNVDGVLVVQFKDAEGRPVTQKYRDLAKPEEPVPMLSDIRFEQPPEDKFKAIFLQLTNLDEFYCHRFNEEEITELMTMGELLLSDLDHQSAPSTACRPLVNGLYMSKFEEVWYRCVVEQIKGSNVVVRYIDFGNCEEKPASDLRPLNKKRVSMPVRLLKCKLHGVTPTKPNWANDEMPEYLKLLSQNQAVLTVSERGQAGSLQVSVFIEESKMDVAQDLVDIGLATFTGSSVSQAAQGAGVESKEVPQEEDDEEEEDEDALAQQIELLQKQLKLAKLKKKAAKK